MIADEAPSRSALHLPERRLFLGRAGKVGLSAAAVALLAGCESMAARSGAPAAGSARFSSPDRVSQMRTTWSSPALANVLPSGAKAIP